MLTDQDGGCSEDVEVGDQVGHWVQSATPCRRVHFRRVGSSGLFQLLWSQVWPGRLKLSLVGHLADIERVGQNLVDMATREELAALAFAVVRFSRLGAKP